MFQRFFALLAVFGFAASGELNARPNGNPDFHLTCGVGSKRVEIATEGGRLVYRFGTPRNTELEIWEDKATPNLFYRYDLLGTKGSGQQIRFVNGQHSYGISSWFIAGASGDEGVAFFILEGDNLMKWRKCKGDDWFSEDNNLDRLPRDILRVSADGVETGKIPGVTPFP